MIRPFYYSNLDEFYPEEYAYKFCAWCGKAIPIISNGVAHMFCSDNCSKEYWNFIPEVLDVIELKGTVKCYLMSHGCKKLGGTWINNENNKELNEEQLAKLLDGKFRIKNDKWIIDGYNHNALSMTLFV